MEQISNVSANRRHISEEDDAMEVSVQCRSGNGHINTEREREFIFSPTTVSSHKIKTTCTDLIIFVIKMTVHVPNGSPHFEWSVCPPCKMAH